MMAKDRKLYIGMRELATGAVHLVEVATFRGFGNPGRMEWEPLVHRVRHSPGGMEWGSVGSGAADLARSILFDFLGEAGLDEGLYQAFKFDVVVEMAREKWTLRGEDIQAWLEEDGRVPFELAKKALG